MGRHNPSPALSDTVTVEASVESDAFRAETLQTVVSKWRIGESFDRFEAYDASATSGLDTRGFFGAVFDGRYVYFVPQSTGLASEGTAPGQHGHVLRYDTQEDFASASGWSAYDASATSGLQTRGYYGAVFDGRYVFFIPRTDGANLHTRILRYDTQSDFDALGSWQAFDIGHAMSCQSAGFDGRYIYCCPGYETEPKTRHCGRILRYDTHSAFDAPDSYVIHDAGRTDGVETGCFDGAVFDGRYVYFVPLGAVGGMLRCDTLGEFTDPTSWDAFDARKISGLKMGTCVGATFDGRYVYYVPYANSVAVRFDTQGEFADADAWSAFDAVKTGGLYCSGYDGAVFDGRFVYYLPFWEGEDPSRGFHGKVLRYDATRDFTDGESWQAVDAGRTSGLESIGFNGGAFDGRFIYMAPWRTGATADGSAIAHGNVLRYDTVGQDASFSLRAVDFGHNGGLCAAVPGPSFLVNTERGVVGAWAHRGLAPGRHHLAGIYDGRHVRLYIDGKLAAERSGSGRIQHCEVETAIGHLEGGLGRFDGRVEDAQVIGEARDAQWVAAKSRQDRRS
ncbi:MAG: hypothetical protein CMJ18_28140 [Phycisphaeraceae bacterium]|nr:hypothetical protein [Phycisphaeraceae bacterium]